MQRKEADDVRGSPARQPLYLCLLAAVVSSIAVGVNTAPAPNDCPSDKVAVLCTAAGH